LQTREISFAEKNSALRILENRLVAIRIIFYSILITGLFFLLLCALNFLSLFRLSTMIENTNAEFAIILGVVSILCIGFSLFLFPATRKTTYTFQSVLKKEAILFIKYQQKKVIFLVDQVQIMVPPSWVLQEKLKNNTLVTIELVEIHKHYKKARDQKILLAISIEEKSLQPQHLQIEAE
jgi:hypothetical protein